MLKRFLVIPLLLIPLVAAAAMSVVWSKVGESRSATSKLTVYKAAVTTGTDGTASGSLAASGWVSKVSLVLGTATGFSFTLKDSPDSLDLLDGTGASLSASKALFPQVNGNPGFAPFLGPLALGVTGGGDTKTASVYVWVKE